MNSTATDDMHLGLAHVSMSSGGCHIKVQMRQVPGQ